MDAELDGNSGSPFGSAKTDKWKNEREKSVNILTVLSCRLDYGLFLFILKVNYGPGR